MTTPHLITADVLHSRLDDSALRIIDATVHLSFDDDGPHIESGRQTYLDGHIPGAVFADQLGALSDPAGEAPFAAATSEQFAAAVGALGVANDTTVVVYDTTNNIWATRLWWQFGLEGFDNVLVLDGGLRAWTDAGYPTYTDESTNAPATFVTHRRPERIASTDDVIAALDDPKMLLVNALDRDSFAGGRIPGSVNVPFPELLDDTGKLKSLNELRTLFDETGALDDAVRPVTYCGGGIAATTAAFALQALGRNDVAVYDGSLNAWTADPERVLEKG
ncbi:sulfurtransferase [Gordonia sp. CPCC 205515]|uniref:sulfurtransferase n=1 Tax=Gordonia sp. CPCC 205515 TaxID=3140791 RepID=UPI003AF37E04